MQHQTETAVVLGGSGAMGSAVCRKLAGRGYDLVLTYSRNPKGAEEVTSAAIRAGRKAEAHGLDLADLAAVEQFARSLASGYERVTALVHCAGDIPRTSWRDTSNDDFVRAFLVNCASAFVATREVAPLMEFAGGGAVVLVSSILAELGAMDRAAYSTSKAALLGLCRALAVELAPKIRVNAVLPGVHATPMVQGLLDNPDLLLRTEQRVPLARLGTAEEPADAVVFLLSAEASYVTGSSLAVDGGVLSRSPLPAADAFK